MIVSNFEDVVKHLGRSTVAAVADLIGRVHNYCNFVEFHGLVASSVFDVW